MRGRGERRVGETEIERGDGGKKGERGEGETEIEREEVRDGDIREGERGEGWRRKG